MGGYNANDFGLGFIEKRIRDPKGRFKNEGE